MSLLRSVCLVGAAAASGCASAPSHYYTLVSESGLYREIAAPASYRVEVEPVKVPAQVDRLELVTRVSDGSLSIADNQRWIAPVADELQSALSVDLTRELGDSEADTKQPAPVSISLRIEVERFEAALSRYTAIESTWHLDLRAGGREVKITCHTHAYEEVGGGYPELVRGYQRAVVQLAREIAGVARASAVSGEAEGCPIVPTPGRR